MKPLPGAAAGDALSPNRVDTGTEDAARARERALVAPRLAAGTMVREIRSARTASRASRDHDEDEEVRGIRLGWASSLILNLVLLFAPIGAVIVLPPVLDCREREARFGFFAGETLQKCASRGIGERLQLLDDRIKMLVRGSGR